MQNISIIRNKILNPTSYGLESNPTFYNKLYNNKNTYKMSHDQYTIDALHDAGNKSKYEIPFNNIIFSGNSNSEGNIQSKTSINFNGIRTNKNVNILPPVIPVYNHKPIKTRLFSINKPNNNGIPNEFKNNIEVWTNFEKYSKTYTRNVDEKSQSINNLLK